MSGSEPIAVVGAGCRFAGGVGSPKEYWDLLIAGRDTVGTIPEERLRGYQEAGPEFAAALRRLVRPGSYLPDIAGFDAEFFGLSPREAELMDPQQRLLLEVGWEALEHAGIPPVTLAGTDTGVFIGVCTDDYGRRLMEDLPRIEAWTGIGGAMAATANRISYALDLRGPSLAVDTACSASLVAVHLAATSLRTGECRVALAGGVSLIIAPGMSLTLDAAGVLAPDGRSKSFDASADGYGRGEGCGVLVLKRLADAESDGDPVLALIVGSAVRQDGRTNGIMAPSGTAQQAVMRAAIRDADVVPASVSYVEAHGTGTRLGDPLEAGALGAVYGAGRDPAHPCLIGSVKANIGHLEAAAGVAAILKVVLALRHRELPPSLLSTPNPAVDWDRTGLRVVTDRIPWASRQAPRRAGVSGFGYGGTIAHVILQEAPPTADPPDQSGQGLRLYPLSAASAAGLRAQAAGLADWLSGPGATVGLDSVGHTLALRRSHLARRAALAAANRTELVAGLRRLAATEPGSSPVDGTGLVWVFSGHGSQWCGMARELLGTEPAFGSTMDSLAPVFLEEIGFTPRQALLDGDFEEVSRTQAMIFAVQVGLAEVWRWYGVRPDAVIGHSVGEIAAAVACGGLTLHAAGRLVCRRARLLRRVAGHGAMAMVDLPFDEVTRRLDGRTDVVPAIAASPRATVVSGDRAAVAALADRWRGEDIEVRPVNTDVAFHSPQVWPLLTELAEAGAELVPDRPGIPMYSTALTDPREVPVLDGRYWAANLRNPVRLTSALEAAAADGYRRFLEISAHPVVAHSIAETLAEAGIEDSFVAATLRRGEPAQESLLSAVAAAHCAGVPVAWTRLQPTGGLATLPPVPWQRRRLWRDSSTGRYGGHGHDIDSHSLLGSPTTVAGREVHLWSTRLSDATRPYPGSHAINGAEVVPAAVLLVTFLRLASGAESPALADIAMRVPVAVTEEQREIQVVQDGGELTLASRAAEDPESWLIHVTGRLAAGAPPVDSAIPPAAPPVEADPDSVRAHLTAVGVPDTGFVWTIKRLRRSERELVAVVCLEEPTTWAPAMDAALSIAPVAFPGAPVLRVVAHLDRVEVDGTPPNSVHIGVTWDDRRPDAVDIIIAAPSGGAGVRLAGVQYAVLRLDPEEANLERPAAPDPFAGLSGEPLREYLRDQVSAEIAAELRLPTADLDPRRSLAEQGLDSVLTMVVRRRLERRFGLRLPAALLWQQPTVAAIARHLAETAPRGHQ